MEINRRTTMTVFRDKLRTEPPSYRKIICTDRNAAIVEIANHARSFSVIAFALHTDHHESSR